MSAGWYSTQGQIWEDSCPEGLTWLEAALFSKMCLQCLSSTLFHYCCALPCTGFCTCFTDGNITGIQHKDIWARIAGMIANPWVEKIWRHLQRESFTTVWPPSALKGLHTWASNLMGQGCFFPELLVEDGVRHYVPWPCLGTDRRALEMFSESSYWSVRVFWMVNRILGQQGGKLVCPKNPWKKRRSNAWDLTVPHLQEKPTRDCFFWISGGKNYDI